MVLNTPSSFLERIKNMIAMGGQFVHKNWLLTNFQPYTLTQVLWPAAGHCERLWRPAKTGNFDPRNLHGIPIEGVH